MQKLGHLIKINQKICLIDKLGHKKDTSWLKKRGRSIFATSGISEFLIRTKSTLISHLIITFKQVKPRFTTTSRATNSIKKIKKNNLNLSKIPNVNQIFQFAWLMWLKKQKSPEEEIKANS